MKMFLQNLFAAACLVQGATAQYNNCMDALNAGESSGTFNIDGTDLYCDMDLDGGGWTYVSRGTYSSDGCTNGAFGDISTDPETNSRWGLGGDAMNAIGFPDGSLWAEYTVFIGHDNDNGYDAHDQFRKSRIMESAGFDMSQPIDSSFGVDVWYGNGWVAETDDCSSSDCGPCWEPNDVNFCCEKTDDTWMFETCAIAANEQEGQWSNSNTNQHLRCDQSDYDQDQLVLYVRPKLFYRVTDTCFASCVHAMAAGFTESGVFCINDQDLFCNQELHGGGWALVARGSDVNSPCNGDAYGKGICSDPGCNEAWSIGNDAMNEIGHAGWETAVPAEYMEYLTTMGDSNDEGYTGHEYFRLQRLTGTIDMSSPMDQSFSVETWSGAAWIPEPDDCNDADCGPCWQPNSANYCCETATGVCSLAATDTEGQYSNTNTNQHLRCNVMDTDQDSLILYVRPSLETTDLEKLAEKVQYNRNNITANVDAIQMNADAIQVNADAIAGAAGMDNDVAGDGSTIGGGKLNTVIGNYASVGGGLKNKVYSNYATVAGGFANIAAGRFAAVLGGSNSRVSGRHSFTLGSFATTKGDFAGTINTSGGDCVNSDDNSIVICADGLTLQTSTGTVDIAGLGRRALVQSDEVASLRDEVQALRDENSKLWDRLESMEAIFAAQQ